MRARWPGDVAVFDDAAAAARAAAERIAALAARAVALRGVFTMALAGGSTPEAAYARLAQSPLRDAIAWDAWKLFFGDERWVPREHPDSNFAMASRAFLSGVPLAPARVHPIPTDRESPDGAAEAYAATLRAALGIAPAATPQLDLVLLGMGEDGHTASLFPNAPQLAERSRLFAAARRPADGSLRVTATPPLLLAARAVLVLVTGSAKSATLGRVWDAAAATRALPITLLREAHGSVEWICDRAAVPQARPAATASHGRAAGQGSSS